MRGSEKPAFALCRIEDDFCVTLDIWAILYVVFLGDGVVLGLRFYRFVKNAAVKRTGLRKPINI